jgi:hypothetical protein
MGPYEVKHMEEKDVEELKELLPQTAGLEAYYDACVTVLRMSFLRVSEAVKDIKLPEIPPELPSQSSEEDAQGDGRTVPGTAPKGTWYPLSWPLPQGVVRPPRPPRMGAGFRLVDVTRLGQFALIGFQWQETGDEIYVRIVDLHELANFGYGVGLVDTLVVVNLLERIGPHWHLHHQMPRIHGLTFME